MSPRGSSIDSAREVDPGQARGERSSCGRPLSGSPTAVARLRRRCSGRRPDRAAARPLLDRQSNARKPPRGASRPRARARPEVVGIADSRLDRRSASRARRLLIRSIAALAPVCFRAQREIGLPPGLELGRGVERLELAAGGCDHPSCHALPRISRRYRFGELGAGRIA